MKITIFGACWIGLLLYLIYKKKKADLLEAVLFSMVLQCAVFMEWQGRQIGPQLFSILLYLIICLADNVSKGKRVIRVYKMQLKVSALLIVFVTVLVTASIKNAIPEQTDWVLYCIQISIYALFVIVLLGEDSITSKRMHEAMIRIISFVLIMGLIQFLMTTNVLPKIALVKILLYADDSSSVAFNAAFYPRLCSTFMEPSYCAPFLVGSFFYVITFGKNTKKSIVLSILLLVEIILTFSSTAYGALFIVGIIYLLYSKKKKALKYLIPLGICAVLFLGVSGKLMEILNKVIFQKYTTGSFATRAGGDKSAIESFISSPVIGTGYHFGRGSQMSLALLGQTGIIGTIAFAGIVALITVFLYKNRNVDYCIPTGFFMLSTVVAMMIAVGQMAFVGFWMALAICAVTVSISRREF